jgi:hypothetical protein
LVVERAVHAQATDERDCCTTRQADQPSSERASHQSKSNSAVRNKQRNNIKRAYESLERIEYVVLARRVRSPKPTTRATTNKEANQTTRTTCSLTQCAWVRSEPSSRSHPGVSQYTSTQGDYTSSSVNLHHRWPHARLLVRPKLITSLPWATSQAPSATDTTAVEAMSVSKRVCLPSALADEKRWVGRLHVRAWPRKKALVDRLGDCAT